MRPVSLLLASLALAVGGGCAAPARSIPEAPSVAGESPRATPRSAERRRRAQRRQPTRRRTRRSRPTRRERFEFPPPPRPASPGFADGVPRARLEPVRLGNRPADRLRSYVGRRDDQATDVGFALGASASLGKAPASLAVDGADDLLTAARKARALRSAKPTVGDFVVFDRVGGVRGARTVGVVVDAVADGTVEFIFLWKGVVRRGFLNRRRADEQRDPAGRTLNTFVLGDRAWGRPGAKYLAGQLWSTYIRAARLRGLAPDLVGQADSAARATALLAADPAR